MFDPQDYMAASDYSIAWLVYLLSAAVLLLLQWRFTRGWQRDLRFLLLALATLVLLLPVPLPGYRVMVPAVGFLLLGGFTGGPAILAPVLVRLAIGTLVVLLLTVVHGVVWRQLQRRRQTEEDRRMQRRRQQARIGV